jgi:FAD/FMN-containing dehydrogenase
MLEALMASPRFRDTGRFVHRAAPTKVYRPANLADLMRCLDPARNAPVPIRIRGAGTAATDCNTNNAGTVIDMTGLDRIVHIDAYNHTVRVEAGVRLGALVSALAEQGLELIGNHDQMERTVGGAIASPCMGACIGGQAAYLSTQVTSLRVITSAGQMMKVSEQQKHLLNAFRLSYGMLGAIYEATLRVRPIATFSASHRSLSIDTFADVANRLASRDIGLKFYLLPHMDRVYLDLRRYERTPGNSYNAPWRIKDWGESTVLPHVFKSLNRVLPIPAMKYRLMDSISAATHGLVNSRLVRNGNNVTAGTKKHRKPRNLLRSTWCFPASDFSVVIKAYREFCANTLAQSDYRTDLPAVGYRVARDVSAILSPSFDEPLIALQTTSTQEKGWENFVIDLAQFAENWGGTPLFSESRALRAEYGKQMYSNRLDFFRRIRRQLDAHGRLLNPFMAQYFE